MQTLRDVIDAFGYAELAAILGKPPGTVSSWKTRGMLPSEFWETVVLEARARGIENVTPELLVRLDAERARRDAERRIAAGLPRPLTESGSGQAA